MNLSAVLLVAAVCSDAPTDLRSADSLYRQGRYEQAVSAAAAVIEQDGTNAAAYALRAAAYEALNRFESAAADWTRFLQLRPGDAAAYQARGIARFKAGKIEASIADFDRYLKQYPEREPYHWQRGIAYYYAGQCEKGVRQFEIHRSVNPQDVENAIWHYLCRAKIDGIEAAQEGLIEITSDRRPWAMPVYRMYQGRTAPDELLAQARQLDGSDDEQRINLFYAHLYTALFYEAQGNTEKTRHFLAAAVRKYPCAHYMGDVARVHLQRISPASGKH